MRPRALFVTGTDTEVGKTRMAAGLCRAFAAHGVRVAGMKPIASGSVAGPEGLRNEDALALLEVMSVRAPYRDVNPYAFEPAIAPHIAAVEAGITIDFEVLDRAFQRLSLQSELVIVEGAGGWLAPIDDHRNFADLAVMWQLPVVLVVGLRLGCLNHALLTVEAIERRGLSLAGWIANGIDPHFARRQENLDTLHRRLASPCLGEFGFEPGVGADVTAERLTPGLEGLDWLASGV